MAKLVKFQMVDKDDRPYADAYYFQCPGCNAIHQFRVCYDSSHHPTWTFDGNMESPTFNPSLLMPNPPRCHLFIHNGIIEYCGDCDHSLKGQHVPMVDAPEWLQKETQK